MRVIFAFILRDLKLSAQTGGGTSLAMVFFLLASMLIPFGIGPDLPLLARIASGTIWVSALLSCLLSLERIFQTDFEDGSLDQMVLTLASTELLVLFKAISHWLATGIPLTLMAPIVAVMFGFPWSACDTLLISLLLGTLGLSLIGAVGAALTLGIRRGGFLMALLVLPLCIPTLIFGAGAVDAAVSAVSPKAHLAFLTSITFGVLALAPFAGASALRINLN